MHEAKNNENWNDLRLFLPKGWTAKAKELGVFTRKREFKSVSILLRTLMIHLVDGCSLKETAVRAEQGKLCTVSGVALHKRLRKSGEWFHWMSLKLLERKGLSSRTPLWLKDYDVKCVDASVICEPGSTGTDWRLHYSMSLFNLKADQFHLTDPQRGESFKNFTIKPGELWLADRAYCHYSQLRHVVDHGADFVVRWKARGASLSQNNRPFNVLEEAQKLKPRQVGNWSVNAGTKEVGDPAIPLRLCVIRKSKKSADKAIRDYKRQAQKKGKSYSESTLELQKYIIIATSLPESISADKVLELYRARWQVEIAFKRLKSLIGIGQLPKKDKESCLAWLQGKFFVSLLIQAVLDEGRLFSPWGYPLKSL
jgi:hypothetical protein